jgi:hypothetical protein
MIPRMLGIRKRRELDGNMPVTAGNSVYSENADTS